MLIMSPVSRVRKGRALTVSAPQGADRHRGDGLVQPERAWSGVQHEAECEPASQGIPEPAQVPASSTARPARGREIPGPATARSGSPGEAGRRLEPDHAPRPHRFLEPVIQLIIKEPDLHDDHRGGTPGTVRGRHGPERPHAQPRAAPACADRVPSPPDGPVDRGSSSHPDK
jgi:hypothetical protein